MLDNCFLPSTVKIARPNWSLHDSPFHPQVSPPITKGSTGTLSFSALKALNVSSVTSKPVETTSIRVADLHPKGSLAGQKTPRMLGDDAVTVSAVSANPSTSLPKSRLNYASLQAKLSEVDGQRKTPEQGSHAFRKILVNESATTALTMARSVTTMSTSLAASSTASRSRSASPDIVVLSESHPPKSSLTSSLLASASSSIANVGQVPAKTVVTRPIVVTSSPDDISVCGSISSPHPTAASSSGTEILPSVTDVRADDETAAKTHVPSLVSDVSEDAEEPGNDIRLVH